MTVEQIIAELRSNDAGRRLRAAEAAADALELLEERIAIMGEALTAEEWQRQEQEARQRIEAGSVLHLVAGTIRAALEGAGGRARCAGWRRLVFHPPAARRPSEAAGEAADGSGARLIISPETAAEAVIEAAGAAEGCAIIRTFKRAYIAPGTHLRASV